MEYELKNPSDPYTFLASDLEVAALTVFSISTLYGAEAREGGGNVPIFLFGGAVEWYTEQFGRTPDEGMEARKGELAAALGSMRYGRFKDRQRYEAALVAITDQEKKEEFIAAWQDGYSSLNNIGAYCHKLAKKLRGQEPDTAVFQPGL